MRLGLFIERDGAQDELVPLPPRGQVTLGRAPGCDVVLDDASVARRHALVDVGPPLRVFDAGSARGGGVVVRGRRLAACEGAEVAVGEVFEVGAVRVAIRALAGRVRTGAAATGEAGGASEAGGEAKRAVRELVERVKRAREEEDEE